MWTIGFGRPSDWSRSRIPNPPQNRTTFMGPPPIHDASVVGAAGSPPSSVHRHFRDGHDESASPIPDVAQLLNDLLLEVPGKDQHEIRLRLRDPVGVVDGYVSARQEPPLLVGIAVDRIFEEIGADAAVVQ